MKAFHCLCPPWVTFLSADQEIVYVAGDCSNCALVDLLVAIILLNPKPPHTRLSSHTLKANLLEDPVHKDEKFSWSYGEPVGSLEELYRLSWLELHLTTPAPAFQISAVVLGRHFLEGMLPWHRLSQNPKPLWVTACRSNCLLPRVGLVG